MVALGDNFIRLTWSVIQRTRDGISVLVSMPMIVGNGACSVSVIDLASPRRTMLELVKETGK